MASSSSSGNRAPDVLFQAAFTGNLDLFKRLANQMRGAFSVAMSTGRDSYGLTVLHHAAVGGRTQVVRFLVEKGKIDVDLKEFKSDQTPLHHAILEEHFDTAVYLLERGANPNARNKKGRTPLHHAMENGPKELIEILISKGADINAMAADCGTPLQYAAAKGKKEFVKVLLDHNANPNLISHDQFCPMLTSIIGKSIDCLNLLLETGADPNLRGSKGMTPLGFAACEGETEVIKRLLRAGADPNITNNCGMTPVEEAVLRGGYEDVAILFPVTIPIPGVKEWSILGLFEHVHSNEAKEERKRKKEERFVLAKLKGTEAFGQKDYFGAIQWFTEAISIDDTNAAVLSNRSLCWLHMNEGDLALEDAEACVQIMPDWPKAHYRAGSAWMQLKKYKKAADAFFSGLKLDRGNKEIELAFRKAIDAQKTS